MRRGFLSMSKEVGFSQIIYSVVRAAELVCCGRISCMDKCMCSSSWKQAREIKRWKGSIYDNMAGVVRQENSWKR